VWLVLVCYVVVATTLEIVVTLLDFWNVHLMKIQKSDRMANKFMSVEFCSVVNCLLIMNDVPIKMKCCVKFVLVIQIGPR
jgi:hypothetical protein